MTRLYGVVLLASLPLIIASRWIKLPEETTPLLRTDESRRDAWVDAARMVLIIFVVLGHFASVPCIYMPEKQYWLAPFLAWINLFVMPGFAVISGHLSKGPLNSARASRLLVYVALPYLVSKLAIWFFNSCLQRSPQYFNPFDTFNNGDVQWYLLCLIQWRLAIEALRPLGRPALLALALVIGLGSGYWVPSGSLMAMQRACSFFPCFVAGHVLDLNRFRAATQVSLGLRWALQLAFLGNLAVFFAWPRLSEPFFAGVLGNLDSDFTFSAGAPRALCGTEWALSFVHRAVRYELMILLLAGLIAIVPASPAWAGPGQHTMYPYLLHPWVCDLMFIPMLGRHPAAYMKSLGPFAQGGFVWAYVLLLAPLLTLALSSGPVRRIFAWMVEPTWAAPLLLTPENAAMFQPKKHAKLLLGSA